MEIGRISVTSGSPPMVTMVMMVMASGLRESELSLMMTVMVMMKQLFADGRV